MLKHKFSKLEELGSLMVEAMAMLALISMVTPILYRKAAERTTELQDINAAGQVRSLVKSIDDYVKDNYDKIVAGKKITQNDCLASAKTADFSSFVDASGNVTIPIEHFCYYLPYGFLGSDKKAQESKTFSDKYKVVIKKVSADNKNTLTAFLVANPGGEIQPLRASRIASMIGSNGGYVQGNQGNGVQGIWTVPNLKTDLGLQDGDYTDGSIMASSMQSITSQGGGDSSENVLYRNARNGHPELNRMETDLSMGFGDGTNDSRWNIRNVHQILINAAGGGNSFEPGTDASQALYVKNGGLNVNDKASITGSGAISGSQLDVGTGSIKGGDATLSGALSAASATITNALTAGSAIINGTLQAGATTLASLNVTGGATIGGLLAANGGISTTNITASGNITSDGDITAKNITATNALHVTGNMDVTGSQASFSQPNFTVGEMDELNIGGGKTLMRNASLEIGTDVANAVNINSTGIEILSNEYVTVTGEKGVTVDTNPGNYFDLQGGLLTSLKPDAVGNGGVYIRDNFYTLDLNNDESNYSFRVKRLSSGADVKSNLDFGYNVGTGYRSAIYAEADAKEDMVKLANGGFNIYHNKESDIKYSKTANLLENMIYGNMSSSTTEGATPTTSVDRNLQINTDALNIKSNVFQVDNGGVSSPYAKVKPGEKPADETDAKGLVYVRRGVIETASNYSDLDTTTMGTAASTSGGTTTPGTDAKTGYIKADRFVDNKALDLGTNTVMGALPNEGYSFVDGSGGLAYKVPAGVYDAYQVNPAYTSVMHDIKLTTRGGARLSDILPDFINKGIYVVDNTYCEDGATSCTDAGSYVGDWSDSNFDVTDTYKECSQHQCNASPWLGYVPAPQCPPGYGKVITITPAGWAMGQAGKPGAHTSPTKIPDVYIPYNPKDIADKLYSSDPNAAKPDPLYFQKSTWLRANVYPHGTGSSFKGWSAIMGFMYPATYYKNYLTWLKGKELISISDTALNDAKTIVWNLFPVWKQHLEAYATVYCYFDRAEFKEEYVGDYDQLENYRQGYTKGKIDTTGKETSTYIKRLNDPTLDYTDPW